VRLPLTAALTETMRNQWTAPYS